ncbi:MAG TPA: hypothetical protein VHR38_11455 [Solirubrobacterales bacterium]|jgi:hypothetical protein|nr:hypothetical protein [Solirubrobacterales bacterium]
MGVVRDAPWRWVVPAALAAVLAAVLLVTPVIGAGNGVTAKKVNKTINKKTNVVELQIRGIRNVGTTSTTLGTLDLNRGNYLVSSTFDARRNSNAENIACSLRLNGVGQDSSSSFTGTGVLSAEDTVAMEVAGRAGAATAAVLSCSSSAGTGQINHAEITALKVPTAKVIKG